MVDWISGCGFLICLESYTNNAFHQYAQDPAWQVITSSASDQKAVDILSDRTLGQRNKEGAKHSPFALALLDGLAGEADTVPRDKGDGVITATELYTYLRDRVEDETTEHGKRQSPSIFSLHKHDKGQYIFLHPNHPLNLPPIPKRNPFMGLKSYNESDTMLFYGRDRVVEALDELTKNNPLVVVSGASGTGKSSVIKAGLLPLLRKNDWQILPIVRPGKEPLKSLKTEIPNLANQLTKENPTLLIIDQYEELITQCLHPEERAAFEEQLATWIKTYPQLHIVISIRSDFEPQFKEATLAEWWAKGRYVVPAFSLDELREVVIKPTVQEVLFFEPDSLVDKLVDEVNQAPGALPLLSFTLSELYHAYINSGRTNRAFILEDYEKLGGVIGALRTRANAIYDGLDEAHQNSMRKLMLRMVSLEGGELASRRVLANDLVFRSTPETKRVKAIAQKLVEARLVSSGLDNQGRTYYEPAHDALVRAWTRLWEWIKAMGEGKLDLIFKLNLAVVDYQLNANEKQAKEYLWNEDPRLDLLFAELQSQDHNFNAQEESFLRESMKARKGKTSRLRIIVGTVIAVLLAISGIAVCQSSLAKKEAVRADEQAKLAQAERDSAKAAEIKAEVARDSAKAAQNRAEWEKDRANREAIIAKAAALSAKARDVQTDNPTTAINLALAAYRLFPGEENAAALHDVLSAKTVFYKKTLALNYLNNSHLERLVAFSPACPEGMDCPLGDGKIIMTANIDSVNLWHSDGNLMKSFPTFCKIINHAVFSPDTKLVLTVSREDHEDKINLINLEGELIKSFSPPTGRANLIAFSPNGKQLLMVGNEPKVNLWSLEGDTLIKSFSNNEKHFISLAIAPDGQRIAAGSFDGSLSLWETNNDSRAITFPGHMEHVRCIAFSPDGKKVVSGGAKDGKVILWDLMNDSNTRIASFSGHVEHVSYIVFTPDGKRICTAGRVDNTVKLWDLEGNLLRTFKGGNRSIAFSPNGKTVLTRSYGQGANFDQPFKMWDIDGEVLQRFSGHTKTVVSLAFSSDGQKILTGSHDNTAKLWDLNGNVLQTFSGHESYIRALAFSPDNKHMLTGSADGSAKWWDCYTGQALHTYPGHKYGVDMVAISPDLNNLTFLLGYNGEAKWLNLKKKVLKTFSGGVSSLTFSPDGQHILTGNRSSATLWNLSGDSLMTFKHKASVSDVAFSPLCEDGQECPFGEPQIILTASADKTAKLWSLDGKELLTVPGDSEDGHKAAFSPSGKKIVTSGVATKLWNLDGKELQTLSNYTGHSLRCFLYSPDGKTILVGRSNETVILLRNFFWEWDNGVLWDRIYKLSTEEQKEYGIDWEY